MADRYWVNAAADNDWHNAGNWSATDGGAGGAGVPTSSDAVFFTGTVLANCSTSGATVECASLTVSYLYTGTIDFRTSNPTVSIENVDHNSGSKLSDLGGVTYTGTGDWTISGNWDSGRKVVTWGGLAIFTGSDKTIRTFYGSNSFKRVEIRGTITTATYNSYAGPNISIGSGVSDNTLLIKSGASLTVNTNTSVNYGSLTIELGGTLDGSGTLHFAGHVSSVMTVAGTLSVANLNLPAYRLTIVPCTIDSAAVNFATWGNAASEFTFQAGSYTFKGDVSFTPTVDGIGITWNKSSVAANCVFQGDVTASSSLTWNKGTGTITVSGSADQAVDFEGKTVEDIVVNKSAGVVTFNDGFATDSFTLTAGTIAFGTAPDTITCSGNWTIGTGGQVDPTNLGGWTWSVGGNLSLSGESGDLLNLAATAAWYLQVTGTATASYVNAAYSDASGYTEIDADDGTNTDGGNNVNWAFAAAGGFKPYWARNVNTLIGGGVS